MTAVFDCTAQAAARDQERTDRINKLSAGLRASLACHEAGDSLPDEVLVRYHLDELFGHLRRLDELCPSPLLGSARRMLVGYSAEVETKVAAGEL